MLSEEQFSWNLLSCTKMLLLVSAFIHTAEFRAPGEKEESTVQGAGS